MRSLAAAIFALQLFGSGSCILNSLTGTSSGDGSLVGGITHLAGHVLDPFGFFRNRDSGISIRSGGGLRGAGGINGSVRVRRSGTSGMSDLAALAPPVRSSTSNVNVSMSGSSDMAGMNMSGSSTTNSSINLNSAGANNISLNVNGKMVPLTDINIINADGTKADASVTLGSVSSSRLLARAAPGTLGRR